jgi:hypothetical protein
MELKELSTIIEDALSAINKRDYIAINPSSRIIDGQLISTNYSQDEIRPENNFVSSLKGEVKTLIKKRDFNENKNPELFPQSEISKYVFDLPQHFDLRKDFEIKTTIFPDLFFHKSQDDTSPENQRIVLECKIDNNLNKFKFQKDLAKLIIYIEQLNFQKGIMLVCNNELEKIQAYTSEFVNKYVKFEKSLSKIEIWIKNYGDDLIILKTF